MRSMKRTLKERMNIINESLMSNMHDEKLEAMLKARHIEPARPDLAQRIILKAQTHSHESHRAVSTADFTLSPSAMRGARDADR
ncbi:MAG: hypothetical protein E6J74_36345 [Deltaproteobacteria bacterium]|nr:MAG: hypothetical protein E6J74_36345 [Deltaproteobacteria bacterium]